MLHGRVTMDGNRVKVKWKRDKNAVSMSEIILKHMVVYYLCFYGIEIS